MCSLYSGTFHLGNVRSIHHNFLGRMGWLLGDCKGWITSKIAKDAKEGFIDVVVRASTEVVVDQVPLAVKGDAFRLHLSVLVIHLVANEYDGDPTTNTIHISVPYRYITIGDPVGHIKKQNAGVTLNVGSAKMESQGS